MKRIALFIDGTDNEGKERNPKNTNVYKLCQKVSLNGQQVKYIAGIGTGYDVGKNLSTYKSRFIDLAFGQGATQRIKDAYLYIAEHYQPGDHVFLFGFSRGAFIARSLAGFLERVGRLLASHATHQYVDLAFYLYWKDSEGYRFCAFLDKMCARSSSPLEGIQTHFLGQWDAVGALTKFGISAARERQLRDIARREQYQHLPKWIRHARHALALHEMRRSFEPMLWSGYDSASQSLEQVWFAGAHADVGGGYDAEDGCSTVFAEVSLHWMHEQAANLGLAFCAGNVSSPDVGNNAPHISYAGKYRLLSAGVRHSLLESQRQRCVSEYLHDSVLGRILSTPETTYPADDDTARCHWADADAATMRLHYRSCYPQARLLPLLNPAQFRIDFDRFCRAATGAIDISFDELARTMSLIAIFGGESTYHLLPEVVRDDWSEPLNLALKLVEEQLREPDHGYLYNRWKRQKSILENFVFRLLVRPRY
jgi:hypothetical protein